VPRATPHVWPFGGQRLPLAKPGHTHRPPLLTEFISVLVLTELAAVHVAADDDDAAGSSGGAQHSRAAAASPRRQKEVEEVEEVEDIVAAGVRWARSDEEGGGRRQPRRP